MHHKPKLKTELQDHTLMLLELTITDFKNSMSKHLRSTVSATTNPLMES